MRMCVLTAGVYMYAFHICAYGDHMTASDLLESQMAVSPIRC